MLRKPSLGYVAHCFSRKFVPDNDGRPSWDMCENLCKNHDWLQEQRRNSSAKLLVVSGERVLITQHKRAASSGDDGSSSTVCSLHYEALQSDGVPEEAFWLGRSGVTGSPFFVRGVPVEAAKESASLPRGVDAAKFVRLRDVASQLSPLEASLAARGLSLVEWHASARFCGYCGSPTITVAGGSSRQCTAPKEKCGKSTYPRTNPVAIMLVIHPNSDHVLLGQSQGRLRALNLFSALAGFVDQGESLEDAVRREVMEEAGVPVGAVQYHSSQAWPFPCNLMLGCYAQATSDVIRFDREEMADVRWFSRSEVLRALNLDNPDLMVPPPIAIAHVLIREWAEGNVTRVQTSSSL